MRTIDFVGHMEFISFRDGFLGTMQEDFYINLYTQDLPEVDFIAPNLDAGLFEIFVKACPIFDKIKNKKGYVNMLDYANLGADLYIALLHDSSFTAYEDAGILDNYIFDLTFDYEHGEYHDVILRECQQV